VAYWSVLAYAVGGNRRCQADDVEPVRARRAGGARDAERVRFLGYNVAGYETTVYTIAGFIARGCGMLLGRSYAICLARAV